MYNNKGRTNIKSLVLIILLLIIIIMFYKFFKLNYFNGFTKAKEQGSGSNVKFSRDSNEKYSNNNSYKICNKDFNDAAFYKEITVEPNTPYKITCMVKTEDVTYLEGNSTAGATIGLLDSSEYAKPISGTNQWQQIEYMFNSKNEEKVKICFRLGGEDGGCKGTAWFADMKVEKGTKTQRTEWKCACFILRELDVKIENTKYNLKTNSNDVENVKLNMQRFKEDCYKFSNKQMSLEYEIYEIKDPVTTISYSAEHGYYVSYKDVANLIYDTAKQYDHIIVVCRMEDDNGENSIPINDNWIGLGGMDMYGIGYSLVRINKNANTYNYKYGITNQAPEEVYLHEFLHTLERNCLERGKRIPALHDYAKYGYTNNTGDGLNSWYKDYMLKKILDKTNNSYVGLDSTVFSTQPPNSDNFKYSTDINFNTEPQNLFEEIVSVFKVIEQKF